MRGGVRKGGEAGAGDADYWGGRRPEVLKKWGTCCVEPGGGRSDFLPDRGGGGPPRTLYSVVSLSLATLIIAWEHLIDNQD